LQLRRNLSAEIHRHLQLTCTGAALACCSKELAMHRDLELIRRILLAVETAAPNSPVGPDAFPGEDSVVLFEHVRLLEEEGYLDAAISPSKSLSGGGMFLIRRLRWGGHDLISQMRSNGWWSKIKSMAAEKGMDMTLDTVKMLAAPAAKKLFGLDLD
jgi:Hypothetical protein (DUF2513)